MLVAPRGVEPRRAPLVVATAPRAKVFKGKLAPHHAAYLGFDQFVN